MFLSYIIRSYKFTIMTTTNQIHRALASCFFIILPLIFFIGLILGFFETKEFRYRTLLLGLFFCSMHGISLQLIFTLDRNLVLKLMSRVLSTHKSFPDFLNKNISQMAENLTEKESTIEIFIFVLSSSLCVFCPYLYYFTKPGIKLNHPDVQLVPFFFQTWKSDSITNFIMWKCIEFIFALAGLSIYYLFAIFLTYVVMNLKIHVKEINRQLNGVIDTHVHRYMNYNEFLTETSQKYDSFVLDDNRKNRSEFQKSIDREFFKIVVYHNFIHSYLAEITELLHKPMTAVFTWYISSSVLFTITFLMITDDFIHIMKVLSLVIHCTVSLRLFCSAVEVIYSMNEKIMDSLYDTSWYYFPPKSRKNFSIILASCQRKYQVKSFGMYVVNLNLFIFAVRIVYSVINIILMMQKKK